MILEEQDPCGHLWVKPWQSFLLIALKTKRTDSSIQSSLGQTLPIPSPAIALKTKRTDSSIQSSLRQTLPMLSPPNTEDQEDRFIHPVLSGSNPAISLLLIALKTKRTDSSHPVLSALANPANANPFFLLPTLKTKRTDSFIHPANLSL